MDIRIKMMRESMAEHGCTKWYYFYFENVDNEIIAAVIWRVNPMKGTQSFVLHTHNGHHEQLKDLVNTYLGAKVFAERFDLDTITFLFEQYAENENLEIIFD